MKVTSDKLIESRSPGYRIAGALAAAALAMAPRIAHACAMCGLPPGDHEAHAFNTSVLFMMLVPYSIVAATVGGFYLAYRSGKRKRNEMSSLTPASQNLAPHSFE
jgi:hypothetical protein